MIFGVGTDIVQTSRMEKMLERHGGAFVTRILTADEAKALAGRFDKAQYLAGRWAAKEAFSKALGTGIGESCQWSDISVVNNTKGRPELSVTGATAETLRRLVGPNHIHLSLSHETDYACATVIIEGLL